jgi:serine/threonine protein kinase
LEAVKKGDYVIDGGVWDEVTDDAKDLVVRMLTLDPEQRITAKDALNHKWIYDSIGPNQAQAKTKVHSALDNFKKFNSGNKLKQAALGFMIQHFMSQKEAQDLNDAFN